MSYFTIIGLLVLGLLAGYISGLVGIGGGVIIVPALIFVFGYSQHTAQGTTLAMLVPPIGILATLWYYQKGYVDIKAALLLGLGFVAGGLIGGKMAIGIPEQMLKQIFGVLLMLLGLKMLLF